LYSSVLVRYGADLLNRWGRSIKVTTNRPSPCIYEVYEEFQDHHYCHNNNEWTAQAPEDETRLFRPSDYVCHTNCLSPSVWEDEASGIGADLELLTTKLYELVTYSRRPEKHCHTGNLLGSRTRTCYPYMLPRRDKSTLAHQRTPTICVTVTAALPAARIVPFRVCLVDPCTGHPGHAALLEYFILVRWAFDLMST